MAIPDSGSIYCEEGQFDPDSVSLNDHPNPVLVTSLYAFKKTALVSLNEDGLEATAKIIYSQLRTRSYTPRTWRTHPLHLVPPENYSPSDPHVRSCLDWIFVISALNFSFWSERDGHPDRYGVEWRMGWGSQTWGVHTGYWSLVAAIDRALEAGIPITNPAFYSSETLCPDELIAYMFRPAPSCSETIPLLSERIAILRTVGNTLCTYFDRSFQGFHDAFMQRYNGRGTALQLVKMVVESFPSFRDEVWYEGQRICLWKRAQILVAEIWAAFYPCSSNHPHPIFPHDSAISELTMFADYRVPQILHHLRILNYPASLEHLLRLCRPIAPGSLEEISIRTASVVAVELLRRRIIALTEQDIGSHKDELVESVSSVLIDFYLWDMAKRVESGDEKVLACTNNILPVHQTRSIWY